MPFVDLFKNMLGLDDISAGVLAGMLIVLLLALVVYGAKSFNAWLNSSNKSQAIQAGTFRDQTGVQLQALAVTERIIEKNNESNQKRDERVAKSLDRVADALTENSRATNTLLTNILTHTSRVDERTQTMANDLDDTRQGTTALKGTMTLFSGQIAVLLEKVDRLLEFNQLSSKENPRNDP